MWFKKKERPLETARITNSMNIASEKEYREQKRQDSSGVVKLLLVSDSHGREEGILRAIAQEEPSDAAFHLGDSQEPAGTIEPLFSCPCYIIAGNCDYYFNQYPREKVVEIGGHRIFLTHGNSYMASSSYDFLAETARDNACDIVFFGHTHVPACEYMDGVWILNPGSISYPRQQGRERSYMVVYLKPGDAVHAVDAWIRYL